MKSSFTLAKVLLSVIAIFFTGCDKNEDVIDSDLVGDWTVVSFENYETSVKITKNEDNTWPQFNGGNNTVSFIKSDSAIGLISGKNVTNTFSGSYTIASKGVIGISNCIWTEINEPEWGRLFHSIENAETYEIRNENLIIFYNQKKNSITLEKN